MAWELKEACEYYIRQGAPRDQMALKELLREVQQEFDGIPAGMVAEMARLMDVKTSFLEAIIRRTPSLRFSDTHCLELCAGPNCGKHRALADYAQRNAGENCQVKFVPCMRMCGKGPNIRWDGTLYHRADEALLKMLLEKQ